MPNLNPITLDQIDIDGNTFTLGATLPGTITTGEVITNITGLNPGISYYFSVVAFNDSSGYSGWAGPIVVYIRPEVRTIINAYSWTWPHSPLYTTAYGGDPFIPISQFSNTQENLFYLSNNSYITPIWAAGNFTSANSSLSKFTGITPPFPGANVTAIHIKTAGYFNLNEKIENLTPGVTYNYSFYHYVEGLTGDLSYRIDHALGLTTYIRQIEPVDQGNFGLSEDNPTNTIRYVTYPTGGTGWKRFVAQFVTNPGQTYGNFSLFSYSTNGSRLGTAYVAAPQLAIGSTAAPFVATTVISNWQGVCADDDKWLAFGDSYGLTYIAPTINPTLELGIAPNNLIYGEGFYGSNTVQRTSKLLKALPQNKRAILPGYFFSDDTWYYYEDSLNFASGNCYTFFENYYDRIDSDQNYPSIWPFAGVSYGKGIWNSILTSLANTGATFDYLISNAEMYGNYGNYNWNTPGLTTAMSSGGKGSYYYDSYRGLTSWNDWLISYGATIANVMGANDADGNAKIYEGWSSGKLDFAVWDMINRAHELRALDAIFEGTTAYYPNAVLAEYEWSYITDGNPIDGPANIAGNPDFWQYYFGNASAPQLYGWMSGIVVNSGICGSNPSYLYFAPNSAGGAGPPNFGLAPGDTRPQKNAWTSFVMGLQAVRSSKRARPNLQITPWIASVKFPGQDAQYPGGSADRPQIGFADINVGYNAQQGLTLNVAGGNSAYYYEMIRHAALSGVKGFLYWNTSSFIDYRIDSDPNSTVNSSLVKFANNQGGTYFIEDMQNLNSVLNDVNDKLGGFTLTTADTSRISWLAPYLASGAPGPNGVTWWWRITTNPGNTTFVNGQTLSVANNNIVGTWVSTTGPTLAGISITYT
jgi:hypothetical protein